MDITKRNKLIEDLSNQPSPAVVPIDRFFDGNDDVGSIGCNLPDHPGIEIFKAILVTLGRRGDVEAVYAQIAELDPGPDSWPFTDTIFVAGTIELDDFKALLKPLQPDEVGRGEHFNVPTVITDKHKTPVLVAWWD